MKETPDSPEGLEIFEERRVEERGLLADEWLVMTIPRDPFSYLKGVTFEATNGASWQATRTLLRYWALHRTLLLRYGDVDVTV